MPPKPDKRMRLSQAKATPQLRFERCHTVTLPWPAQMPQSCQVAPHQRCPDSNAASELVGRDCDNLAPGVVVNYLQIPTQPFGFSRRRCTCLALGGCKPFGDCEPLLESLPVIGLTESATEWAVGAVPCSETTGRSAAFVTAGDLQLSHTLVDRTLLLPVTSETQIPRRATGAVPA